MKSSIRFKAIILAAGIVLQLGALSFCASAAPGDVDFSFDAGSGVDGTVRAVALQPDGKLIIGGKFTTVKGLVRRAIARLNADGSGDPAFDPGAGVEGHVHSVALQPDGKVLIGGAFIRIDGTSRRSVARLNPDGTLDAGFNPVIESGSVNSLALRSDGKVLIGGTFLKVNGINRGGVALLLPGGTLDTSFDPGPVAYSLNSIVPLADGKAFIAGIAPPLWRLNADGSRDTTFAPDWQSMGEGFSIAVQLDGKVLIGNAPVETSPNGILRLNADGTPDSSFQTVTGNDSYVHSVTVQPDGKLLIAGSFTTGAGPDLNGIARLNADGTMDPGFTGQMQPVYPYDLSTVATQADGKLIVGGSFLTVSGAARRRLARLNSDGSVDNTFDPGSGVAGFVSSLACQPDGRLIAGGRGIDRLNADGRRDATFIGEFTPPEFSAALTSVALQPDGKVFLGAGYSRILRLNANGSLDSSLQPVQEDLSGPSAQINAVAVQSDGQLIIAGNFDSINGSPRYSVARLNSDGTVDGGFLREEADWDGGNFTAMIIQPDGKVVLGGLYFEVNAGALAGYVRRFHTNGDADETFTKFVGVPHSAVRALALQPDGKFLVGGSAGDGGLIVRLHANGTVDAGFSSTAGPNGPVRAIAVQSNGKVLIGGDFTSFNTANRNRIVRLNADGSLDTGFHSGTGFDGSVSSIVMQPDGNVLAGGSFLTVNGVLRPYVARLYGDSTLPLLSITKSGAFAILSWPATPGNFQLQQTTDLSLLHSWSPVAETVVTNGAQVSVTVPTTAPRKFFRLVIPKLP